MVLKPPPCRVCWDRRRAPATGRWRAEIGGVEELSAPEPEPEDARRGMGETRAACWVEGGVERMAMCWVAAAARCAGSRGLEGAGTRGVGAACGENFL
jgi:hypothetical protein